MTPTPTAIALITGGSRGLGRNIALKLAEQGTDIILTYKSDERSAQEVVKLVQDKGRRAVALQLDADDTASFPAFVRKVGESLAATWQRDRFDKLVSNAGTGIHANFAETTEAQFDELVAVHLKGVFFLTQKLLPLINDGGRIVNVSSGLARFTVPGYSAYAAMKGGVEVLTRYMAKELASRGITVNTIAPGPIETDFNGGAVRDNAQLNAHLASLSAFGRVGVPDDVGGAVAALLSGGNGWVTGQRIEVSGGTLL